MLLRELGIMPSAALRDAARATRWDQPVGISARAHVIALKDSALDALSAGAAEVGIERLRAAASAARDAHETELAAECQLELGIALVHGVHSHDDEGAVVLAGAIAAAGDDDGRLAAIASIESTDFMTVANSMRRARGSGSRLSMLGRRARRAGRRGRSALARGRCTGRASLRRRSGWSGRLNSFSTRGGPRSARGSRRGVGRWISSWGATRER